MPDRTDFRDRYGPWALVAGGTEGLGLAWCHEAAARGLDVVTVGLDADETAAAAEAVARDHGVATLPVVQDLAAPGALGAIGAAVGHREVGLLVCNAALAPVGSFLATPLPDLEAVVELNVATVLRLVHAHATAMAGRGRGGIVLMASMSGLQGTDRVATYAATKAFDLVLGEGLHAELGHHGVDVLSVIGPTIDTPNLRRTQPRGRIRATAPEVVAREGLDALGRRASWVPGRGNRLAASFLRLLPRHRAIATVGGATRRMYPPD